MLNWNKESAMKLKHNPKIWLPLLALVLCGLAAYLSLRPLNQEKTLALNQQDLAQMIKPSIVRIINHATGQAAAPVFDVQLNPPALVYPEGERTLKAEKIDLYLSGSGFVVNPDGYILTNAHVATEESLKESYLEEILLNTLEKKLNGLDEQTLGQYFKTEGSFVDFYKNSLAELETRSQFNLQSKLTVLNPSESQEYLSSLIKTGFEAQIISANSDFVKDEKDIALIKIDAKRLPALLLGDSTQINMGEKIFVFGFPSTAEVNGRSPLEATLTQGLVSAVKFSQNKEFKILQTDAKISQGSSGGPLLDQNGRVAGIITFQTGDALRQKGDNFAFAVPINLSREFLTKNNIKNTEGEYATLFRQAVGYYHTNQCQKALSAFSAAAELNSDFVSGKVFENYTKNCEALIAAGKSEDTAYRQAVGGVKKIDAFTWFVVGGRLLLILLALLALEKLYLRLKKDEAQIEQLEISLQAEEDYKNELLSKMEKSGTPLPLPEAELHADSRLALNLPHPHLVDFIIEGRKVGMGDNQIHEELLQAGWKEEEISQAFSHS